MDDTAREQFRAYVVARSPALRRFAVALTGDHGHADDLLQVALTRVYFAWARVSDPDAYVRKAMVNTYASWWRRKWRGEQPTEVLPDRAGADAYGAVDNRDAVWQALARLPRKQRAVLVLRYYEDLSEAETARVLGVPEGTVKSQAARGLARLRELAGDSRPAGNEVAR